MNSKVIISLLVTLLISAYVLGWFNFEGDECQPGPDEQNELTESWAYKTTDKESEMSLMSKPLVCKASKCKIGSRILDNVCYLDSETTSPLAPDIDSDTELPSDNGNDTDEETDDESVEPEESQNTPGSPTPTPPPPPPPPPPPTSAPTATSAFQIHKYPAVTTLTNAEQNAMIEGRTNLPHHTNNQSTPTHTPIFTATHTPRPSGTCLPTSSQPHGKTYAYKADGTCVVETCDSGYYVSASRCIKRTDSWQTMILPTFSFKGF
jgi:hypothetical protein